MVNNRVSFVEKHISSLYAEIDAVQQHGRRENLEFEGLCAVIEKEKCTAKEAVVALINTELEMTDVKPEHISTAHGFHKNGKPDNEVIYAKFTTRDMKNEVFEKRSKLKKDGQRQKYFINQNLTPYRKGLFVEAKKVPYVKYKWVTKNGDILMKKDENAKTVKILNHTDLARYRNDLAPRHHAIFRQNMHTGISKQNNNYAMPGMPPRMQHSQITHNVTNNNPIYTSAGPPVAPQQNSIPTYVTSTEIANESHTVDINKRGHFY